MGAHHGWRAEGKRNRVSAYTALGHKAGDNLGAALKGSHKSVIYWEGGGSGGSFGTLGPGAKLIVNTNNQSTRPIQWLAPVKPGCSFGGRPAEGRRWRVVGWGRSMGWSPGCSVPSDIDVEEGWNIFNKVGEETQVMACVLGRPSWDLGIRKGSLLERAF